MPGIFDVVNDASLTSFVLLRFGQSFCTSGIWLFREMLNKGKVVITCMRKYSALYVVFANSPSLALFFWVKWHILNTELDVTFASSKEFTCKSGQGISFCSVVKHTCPQHLERAQFACKDFQQGRAIAWQVTAYSSIFSENVSSRYHHLVSTGDAVSALAETDRFYPWNVVTQTYFLPCSLLFGGKQAGSGLAHKLCVLWTVSCRQCFGEDKLCKGSVC